ncbi:MAG: glycyl-radical enzyme activating protein [Oscillospiraceae bacterium]|jgi:pyruvate formate lyase activating enzyme|nr:glycyl-radical enzyme activating protein [Oscillospiraceae bacterium]
MSEITGTVFNIQRYSIDDGPGIRTTVFLKGCPLRCPWCSNPESQNPQPQLSYRYTSCKQCGACAAACPNGAIALGADGVVIDREKCVVCGTCAAACPENALQIKGETMNVAQVWKVIRRDAVYYETSGGGVTCSGGEILAQAAFVAEIFKKCRDEGIHTCADTSGFGTADAMNTILEYADLVYFDLKLADPARHAEVMGVAPDVIWANLKLAAERGVKIVLRVPLIPEYNNAPEQVTALAEFARDLAPDAEVCILPYHRYGANKYASVGMTYALDDLRENTDDELTRAREIFEGFGFTCTVSK